MAGHGGARPGSGRKSAFEIAQREKAAKEAVTLDEKRRKAALKKSWQQIEKAAADGEKWAIQMLIEHEVGRPGAKVQAAPDTSIQIIQRFPRGPFTCPACGYKDKGIEPEPKETLIENEDGSANVSLV